MMVAGLSEMISVPSWDGRNRSSSALLELHRGAFSKCTNSDRPRLVPELPTRLCAHNGEMTGTVTKGYVKAKVKGPIPLEKT